jgi:hypothetical protein
LEVLPEDEDIPASYFDGWETPLSGFELDDEEFDKQDISVSIENSIRLEFDPGDTDEGVSKKLAAVFPFELFEACRESVELVLFIFTLMPPPPVLLDEGIELAGEAGILGDPGKEDDLKFCC